MAPAPIVPEIVDVAEPRKDTLGLPESTAARLKRANIDLSNGYPYRPSRPLYLDDVYKIRARSGRTTTPVPGPTRRRSLSLQQLPRSPI